MRLLLIEDEEKTSTYMSGFIASTPPGQVSLAITSTGKAVNWQQLEH